MAGTITTFNGVSINDGINFTAKLVADYNLPIIQPQFLERTGAGQAISNISLAQHQLTLGITIDNVSNQDVLRTQLQQLFDGKDGVAKPLEMVIGGVTKKIHCLPLGQSWNTGGLMCVIPLAIDGAADPHYRWRKTTLTTNTWNISSSPATTVITVDGEDEVYAIFTITPTSAKSTGYAYKRWIPLRWRSPNGAASFPVDIVNASLNTASLISGGKLDATGADLQVEVDGSLSGRTIGALNTSNSKVWVTMDFSPAVDLTLTTAIPSSGAINVIDFNEDISGLDSAGILMIGSEAFLYTAKNDVLRRVSGITRAVRGTSSASHSSGAAAWWVQHDIWLLYGKTVSPSGERVKQTNVLPPIFNTETSTNEFWDYDDFYYSLGGRSAMWTPITATGQPGFYGGNQGSSTDPLPNEELGIYGEPGSLGGWLVSNPCGIVSANFQNGEQKITTLADSVGVLISKQPGFPNYANEYTIPNPSGLATWEAWSRDETLIAGSTSVGILLYAGISDPSYRYIEVDDVALTIDSDYTPTTTVGAEVDNYELDCYITNQATNQSMRVHAMMEVNETLIVDSDAKTVTYELDNSSQFGARTLMEGARLQWLPLLPGANTIEFEEDGLTGLTLEIDYYDRYYS